MMVESTPEAVQTIKQRPGFKWNRILLLDKFDILLFEEDRQVNIPAEPMAEIIGMNEVYSLSQLFYESWFPWRSEFQDRKR